MICTLTARRLKPGTHEEFRAAWGPRDERPPGTERWRRIYHCSDVDDPAIVLSLGFFDGTFDELRAAQGHAGRGEQLARIAPLVDEVLLDGAYEIVEALGDSEP